jgi:hypothetical protein
MLAEAGDKPYDFHLRDEDEVETRYHFNADGTPYTATITHFGKDADVTFHTHHGEDEYGEEMPTFHMTGEQGMKAGRILSTVHHIVKRHVAKHPELRTIGFTSDTTEPSRASLYHRYTMRMGGTTHRSNMVYDTNVHTVPADAYRK